MQCESCNAVQNLALKLRVLFPSSATHPKYIIHHQYSSCVLLARGNLISWVISQPHGLSSFGGCGVECGGGTAVSGAVCGADVPGQSAGAGPGTAALRREAHIGVSTAPHALACAHMCEHSHCCPDMRSSHMSKDTVITSKLAELVKLWGSTILQAPEPVGSPPS